MPFPAPTPPGTPAARPHMRVHLPNQHTLSVSGNSRQDEQLLQLLTQNTQLTETTRWLSERIEPLTREIHAKLAG